MRTASAPQRRGHFEAVTQTTPSIGRPADVVGIFPNDQRAIRLAAPADRARTTNGSLAASASPSNRSRPFLGEHASEVAQALSLRVTAAVAGALAARRHIRVDNLLRPLRQHGESQGADDVRASAWASSSDAVVCNAEASVTRLLTPML